MSKQTTYTINIRDLASPKLNKMFSSVKRIKDNLNKVNKTNFKPLANSIDSLNKKLDGLKKKRDLSVNRREIRKLNKEIVGTENSINRLKGRRSSGIGGGISASALLGGLGITAGVAGVSQLSKAIFQISAEREKQQAILKIALGSEEGAKVAMQNIVEFASKTPFQVTELTDAFIKLNNQGFKPTMKQMTMLGDFSSSVGKSFDQLSEALLDARMGEFERLKEFGVKAKSAGDKVTFTFRGISTTVDKTAESIDKYIIGLGKLNGIQGSMAAISDTVSGKVSNLSDNWDKLLTTIGSAKTGAFKTVIDSLNSFLQRADTFFKTFGQKKEEGALLFASKFNKEIGEEYEKRIKGRKTTEDERLAIQKEITSEFKNKLPAALKLATTQYRKYNKEFSKLGFLQQKFTKEGKMLKYLIAVQKGEIGEIEKLQEKGLSIGNIFSDTEKRLGIKKIDANKKDDLNKITPSTTRIRSNAPKNFNITINKLIEEMNIESQTMEDGYDKIKEEVTKALLGAFNDVQLSY